MSLTTKLEKLITIEVHQRMNDMLDKICLFVNNETETTVENLRKLLKIEEDPFTFQQSSSRLNPLNGTGLVEKVIKKGGKKKKASIVQSKGVCKHINPKSNKKCTMKVSTKWRVTGYCTRHFNVLYPSSKKKNEYITSLGGNSAPATSSTKQNGQSTKKNGSQKKIKVKCKDHPHASARAKQYCIVVDDKNFNNYIFKRTENKISIYGKYDHVTNMNRFLTEEEASKVKDLWDAVIFSDNDILKSNSVPKLNISEQIMDSDDSDSDSDSDSESSED